MSELPKDFRSAVESIPNISDYYRQGLQALTRVDRQRLRAQNPRQLEGSLNLDKALETVLPDAPRWDYGVAKRSGSSSAVIVWIEVHPANGDTAKEVTAKAQWLRGWLRAEGRPLDQDC